MEATSPFVSARAFMIYTVCHCISWNHSRSLSHGLCLFLPTFPHPHTLNIAGKETALHTIICHACVCTCLFLCPSGLPASKFQNEGVGSWGTDGSHQGWTSVQTWPSTGPQSGNWHNRYLWTKKWKNKAQLHYLFSLYFLICLTFYDVWETCSSREECVPHF